MKKKKTKKTVSAKKKLKSKPAAKKVAKKKVAKKPVKAKAQKKKKSAPVQAKKKLKSKPAAKKVAKKVSKVKVKSKKSLPGYPHYSSKEDIMNPANKAKKVTLKEDMLIPTKKVKRLSEDLDEKPFLSEVKNKKTRSSSKLTNEDQDLLGSDELNPDLGDDAVLKNRVWPVDMAGDDLDIPGAELDDANEILGDEDEENNNYSIGGDRHDDLEESPDSGL